MRVIDTEEINNIRMQTNIVDIISSYIPLESKGKNYFGVCPFHDDHSPSMSVDPSKQIFKCFSCGVGGNVFTFVMRYLDISFLEAVQVVADKIGYHLDVTITKPKVVKHVKELEALDLSNKYFINNLKSKEGSSAREYLQKRGLTKEIISEFQIGLSLKDNSLMKFLQTKSYEPQFLESLGLLTKNVGEYYDLFKNRITFAIHNNDGQVVGFTARVFNNEKDVSKYMNTKETIVFKKGEILYNYHNALSYIRKEKSVIVVEGNMDAIRLSCEGVKNVVALMGSTLTSDNLMTLKKLKAKIILCLDNDDAGKIATYQIGEAMLKENIDVEVIRLSGKKDPDEYVLSNGIEAFLANLKKPMKYMEFKLEYLKENKDLSNNEELASYINEVLKSLDEIDDEILKEITLNDVSKKYGISIELLKSKMTNTKKAPPPKIFKKEVVRKDKYIQAAEKIIFFMINDSKYIKMYEKKLGYLKEVIHRNIVMEILCYYELHKNINPADFISFVSDKEDILSVVLDIISSYDDSLICESEMENYLVIAKTAIDQERIKKYKELMAKELDINKKKEYASKIAQIKKGREEND